MENEQAARTRTRAQSPSDPEVITTIEHTLTEARSTHPNDPLRAASEAAARLALAGIAAGYSGGRTTLTAEDVVLNNRQGQKHTIRIGHRSEVRRSADGPRLEHRGEEATVPTDAETTKRVLALLSAVGAGEWHDIALTTSSAGAWMRTALRLFRATAALERWIKEREEGASDRKAIEGANTEADTALHAVCARVAIDDRWGDRAELTMRVSAGRGALLRRHRERNSQCWIGGRADGGDVEANVPALVVVRICDLLTNREDTLERIKLALQRTVALGQEPSGNRGWTNER